MEQAIHALEVGMEVDLVTIDLQECWNYLQDMSGVRSLVILFYEIFSRFCFGK